MNSKTKMLGFAMIAVFVLSVGAQTATVSADTQFIETNFELFYYTSSGSRITESYALYIKQALAPLGIDVRIFAKPFGQFVGDLLHSTAGRPFDLAHVRFVGGGTTPDFAWHYASDNYYFGGAMLQLHKAEWQDWQPQDIGYTTAEVDEMIYEIETDLDLNRRYDNFDTFNQFYFDNLLYDLPMVGLESRSSMWKGYGGPNNELWDQQEGIMPSRALGAVWDAASTPAARKSALNELVLDTTEPNGEIFDPDQSKDSAQTDIVRYMQTSLLTFDKGFLPHPSIAWNFAFGNTGEMIDHDNNATTPEHGVEEYTFLIRDDAYWPATTDKDGNAVPTTKVTANDFKLMIDFWLTFLDSEDYSINGEYNYAGLWSSEVSTTLFPDDTITIKFDNTTRTPDDILNYGSFSPLPSHLLGGDLHWTNATDDSDVRVEPVGVGMTFNPWQSDEWNHWETFEGHALVGPYDIVEFESKSHYTYEARADWFYPNEWDVDTYYDGADAEIVALEERYDVDLSVWAPSDGRMADKQEAYYWAYAGDETSMTKPTTQGIEKFSYLVIIDVNNRLIKFEAGELDAFAPTALGADEVEKHENNDNYVVKSVKLVNRGPELLIFNLINPHLKKINVRKAISLAIDRDKLVAIHDGFANPWFSIAYPNMGFWDNVQATGHDFSYEGARDLMRLEGYQAADSNSEIPEAIIPGLGDLSGLLGIPGFGIYMALFAAFIMVPAVRRRR